MTKVAILYSHPSHFGIVTALKQQGHEVESFYYGWQSSNSVINLYNRAKKKYWGSIEGMFNKSIKRFVNTHKKKDFDILLIIKGHNLNRKAANQLGGLKLRKIQWTTDSLSRHPGQAALFPLMDKLFIQDGQDLFGEYKNKMEWLPLGFDENLFKYRSEKDIDLLLIGKVKRPQYQTRASLLLKLSALGNRGYRVVFAGSGWTPVDLNTLRENNVEIFGPLPLEEYAALISRSRCCANIHQDDGGMAVNPLFAAIPSVGTYMITEEFRGRKEYLKNWAKNSGLIIESSEEDAIENVEEVLTNYRLPELYQTSQFREDLSYQSIAGRIIS